MPRFGQGGAQGVIACLPSLGTWKGIQRKNFQSDCNCRRPSKLCLAQQYCPDRICLGHVSVCPTGTVTFAQGSVGQGWLWGEGLFCPILGTVNTVWVQQLRLKSQVKLLCNFLEKGSVGSEAAGNWLCRILIQKGPKRRSLIQAIADLTISVGSKMLTLIAWARH